MKLIFSIVLVMSILTSFEFFKTYEEVKIGSQVWMAKNLNVETFRNGDEIKRARTSEAWEKAYENKEPAWCYHKNNPDNGDKYGKLYNWYAVNDPRGLAPEGWEIPSQSQWKQLTKSVSEEAEAGKKMKSKSGWKENGNGTNESGFSGLPGGFRAFNGDFHKLEKNGRWWSTTEYMDYRAHYLGLSYDKSAAKLSRHGKGLGFSVRCIKK